MAAGLSTPTKAPGLPGPRSSLLSAATVVRHKDDRFAVGVEWRSKSVTSPGLYDLTPTVSAASAEGKVGPHEGFGVIAEVRTSGLENPDFADLEAEATEKLEATEAYLIEEQFTDNTLSLTDFDAVIDDSPDPSVSIDGGAGYVGALATLDQVIAETTMGAAQGVILVRPHALTALNNLSLIRREGNIWLTPGDNILVGARGMPDNQPDGTAASANTDWFYAVGPVTVHLGPVVTTPDTIAEATDRQTNEIAVQASRLAAVTWDKSFLHAAVVVDTNNITD